MTLKVSSQVPPIGTKLIEETAANSTSKNSVTGAAGTLYLIDIDNSANSVASFLKIYDNPNPVVGTTAPDYIVKVAANQRRSMAIPEGLNFNDLSFACVTTGGTAGTVSPASSVAVRMVTT